MLSKNVGRVTDDIRLPPRPLWVDKMFGKYTEGVTMALEYYLSPRGVLPSDRCLYRPCVLRSFQQ